MRILHRMALPSLIHMRHGFWTALNIEGAVQRHGFWGYIKLALSAGAAVGLGLAEQDSDGQWVRLTKAGHDILAEHERERAANSNEVQT